MGCEFLFCCFKNMFPNTIAFISIICNIIALVFLIWGATDLFWYKKARKALYLISFTLFCLTLIAMIFIIVFLNIWPGKNFKIIVRIGQSLCYIIIGLCILAFIILLIAEILIIKDYNDIQDELIEPGSEISSLRWIAAIVPGILGLITTIIISLCTNILYNKIDNNTNQNENENQHINPNSTISIANGKNPVVDISGNNSGIIPSKTPYNQPNT